MDPEPIPGMCLRIFTRVSDCIRQKQNLDANAEHINALGQQRTRCRLITLTV
jgi:hypothetical protein